MSGERIRRLKAAIGAFSELTGRRLNSRLVAKTLREGEYKSDLTTPTPELGSQDDLQVPAFLKRAPTEADKAVKDEIHDKAKKSRAELAKAVKKEVSERTLSKTAVIEAMNRIQDAGYLRGKTKLTRDRNVYQFFHHSRPSLTVVVERTTAGLRLSGADKFLAEFDVAPGGPMKTDTLAMGQADGTTMDEHLGADADTKDYIDDFAKSDAPQFTGKSKEKRRQMAIAASYKGK